MHWNWTMSVDTFLHLLIIIITNCVILTQSDNSDSDYNHFESKYFGENETYNNDKRLIIEDFYRQSAFSMKSIKDINFQINNINSDNNNNNGSSIIESFGDTTATTSLNTTLPMREVDSLSITSRSNSSIKTLPIDNINNDSNKNDKLKWLLNSTIHPNKLNNSNNYGTKPTHGSSQPKKTDAPMLNLVYDSHIKQRYPDFRLGTHFDQVAVGSLINVTIQDGKTAYLNCKINLLQDKTVTWVRRIYHQDPNDESHEREELQLLTVGTNTFVADSRYSVDFQYPSNFRLLIRNVSKQQDEGVYECQISTHPPKVIQFYLHVNAPELFIADENLNPLYERHYEVNSTLELYCYVRNIEMTSSVVLWIHNDHVLNYDAIRGGISVRTDLTEEGANSTLSVAKINKLDSGNYTCSIGPTHSFTTQVHVLNESFAELFYHGCSVSLIKYQIYTTQTLVMLLMAFLLSTLNKLLNSLPSNEYLSIR
ncbi:hypothetical protein PVAND_009143 [Polypedilum vanderplanki]|uniref:Ig-like domain-containing protein n=1 Tax=Polypedilum vanderplanki TaxID=319348 RepID=A0A9J6CC76_POLVA|nr:hypothetical protein PVAND_009143 [Polypedilum vanderplanki]